MAILEKVNPVTAKVRDVKPIRSMASTGSMEERQASAANGNKDSAQMQAAQYLESKKKDLDQAVENVSGYIQNITRELNFSVDEELNSFVVKVLDQETGAVIRQIPTEEMIELAKSLAESQKDSTTGILFQGKA